MNGDGVVDFEDALVVLDFLIIAKGEDALSPLTPTYDEDHIFNWDQQSLPRSTVRSLDNRVGDQIRNAVSAFIDRQGQTCGQASSVGDYSKGSGPDPTINWDDGYQFDPNAKATGADYWNWVKYGTLLTGAQALNTLPDGTRAYSRYWDASGTELTVDYDKAIQEDSAISAGVDAEIQAVLTAVEQVHDGSETSFSFYSTGS